MIYCETYELLSFFDSLRLEDDLVVEACKINRLANLLREEHIKCIFNEEDFEVAAYEYPSLLEVRSTEIIPLNIYRNYNKEACRVQTSHCLLRLK